MYINICTYILYVKFMLIPMYLMCTYKSVKFYRRYCYNMNINTNDLIVCCNSFHFVQ